MSIRSFININKTAFLLSLLYVVPAMVWVLVSDTWLFTDETLSEVQRFQRISVIKSASFVLAVGVLIFFILKLYGKKLQETKMQYKNLFQRHPNPMWIYDKKTLRFVSVNEAAIKHYGYTENEFLQMRADDIRPAEEVDKMKSFISGMEKGMEYSHKWKHKKKNGEIITIEATANDVIFEKKDCWLISIVDITEREKKDEEIRKLSLVAENATTSMIILDSEARIEWVSKYFTLLTGYTLEEVEGRRPYEFLHGPLTDVKVKAEMREALESGEPFSGEIINYGKNGSYVWLRLDISPVWSQGRITNYIAIQTNITAIVSQNKQLRELAYTVSHEFRQPLANIIGLVNELQYKDHSQPEYGYLKQSAEALDAELRNVVSKMSCILQENDEMKAIIQPAEAEMLQGHA